MLRRVVLSRRAWVGFAVALAAMAALPSAAQPAPTPSPRVEVSARDANGVVSYRVTSEFLGAAPSIVRILAPDKPAADMPHRFLYILPVDVGVTGRTSGYSDGLEELRILAAHNRYNLTLVAPSFNQPPWYGDHESAQDRRQESFIVKDLVAFTDSLAPAGERPVRWLIGFSKSGFGALTLLLRHPEIFDAAAAFDAPVQATSAKALGAADVFGSEANFDRYEIPTLIKANADRFASMTRIWLGGDEALFTHHMIPLHNQLVASGIPHVWARSRPRDHSWDSGWLDGAVKALAEMRRD